jgi:hypothetical protein
MMLTAGARRDGVSVEVAPGGALRSLSLTPEALRRGGAALARTILGLVDEAAAQAGERAKHALGELSADEFASLGLAHDEALTETAESTTPDTWRV